MSAPAVEVEQAEVITESPPAAPATDGSLLSDSAGSAPDATPAPNLGVDGEWKSGYEPALRDSQSLKAFKGHQEVANAYVSLERKLGANPITRPTNDTPEEQARFYSELGRPDDAAGYDFENLSFGEGDGEVEIDSSDWLLDGMREPFHNLGLEGGQARGVVTKFNELIAENAAETAANQAQQSVDSNAHFRREWGTNFDSNLSIANSAGRQLLGDDFPGLLDAVDPSGVQYKNNRGFINKLLNFGNELGEDRLGSGSSVAGRTPGDAMAQYNENLRNQEFGAILLDPNHRLNAEHQKLQSDLLMEAKGE